MGIAAAYIMPHPPLAVDGVSGDIEKTQIPATIESFERIGQEIADMAPSTIIVTSPHSVSYSDYFHISPGRGARGDFSMFGSDVGMSVEYDTELVDNLSRFCADIHFPAGTKGEEKSELDHGTMVPLYFVNKYYTGYKLVRISLSGLSLNDHLTFGKFIKKVCDNQDKKIIFIASGDLSHYQKDEGPYGYRPEGPMYDEKVFNILNSGDLSAFVDFDPYLLERAGECGHRSFCIMAGALYDEELDIEVMSHENTFGVGYGFAKIKICFNLNRNYITSWEQAMQRELERYHAAGTSRITAHMEAAIMEYQDKDEYVALARRTIDALILGMDLPDPDDESLSEEIRKNRAGAFVSIHKQGELRGCIGTIMATRKSVSAEIIGNAIAASTQDPRFPKISEEELPYLDIKVDILTVPELIVSEDELDPKKYGVIVQSGNRHGVLLPDLEGVDTVEEQLSIVKRKAGIGPEEVVEMLRFSVERHS